MRAQGGFPLLMDTAPRAVWGLLPRGQRNGLNTLLSNAGRTDEPEGS